MDLYCPVCGEPWDFDTLHEEAQERYGIDYYNYDDTSRDGWLTNPANRTKNPEWNSDDYDKIYQKVSGEFRSVGCKALGNLTSATSCKPRKTDDDDDERDGTFGLTRAEASAALYDILGDDMDGAAAMLDDLNF